MTKHIVEHDLEGREQVLGLGGSRLEVARQSAEETKIPHIVRYRVYGFGSDSEAC